MLTGWGELWHTLLMNYELHKTSKSHYEVQYSTIGNDGVWYSSNAANQQFKSFIEAAHKARELVEHEKNNKEGRLISQYRVVEHVVTTTTEQIKLFTV